MIKSVLWTLILISLSTASIAQSLSKYKQNTIRVCLDQIYAMDFNKADSVLNQYSENFSRQPSYYLLKAYYLRWKYLPITEESEIYEEYRTYLDSTLLFAEELIKSKERSLEASYYKMSAHIMSAELSAANGDFVKGAFEGRKALPIIKKGFDLQDENHEFYISTALYNYYIEHYRNKGFFYRSLLFTFSKGDQEEGLRLLSKGYEKGLFTSVESLLYLAHINFKFEKKPIKGLEYMEALYKRFPTNFKFQEMYIENLLACSKYKEASLILDHFKKTNNIFYQSKAMLFTGIIALEFSKNINQAEKYIQRALHSIDKLPGDNDHYKSVAYLKLAQLHEINGNLAQSEVALKKAKKLAKYPYITEEVNKLDI